MTAFSLDFYPRSQIKRLENHILFSGTSFMVHIWQYAPPTGGGEGRGSCVCKLLSKSFVGVR